MPKRRSPERAEQHLLSFAFFRFRGGIIVGNLIGIETKCFALSGLGVHNLIHPVRRLAAFVATLCPGLVCGYPFGSEAEEWHNRLSSAFRLLPAKLCVANAGKAKAWTPTACSPSFWTLAACRNRSFGCASSVGREAGETRFPQGTGFARWLCWSVGFGE